jgi:methylenetetrahydrofolate dehydrogenase (NADP+)/methenyltetrahydrofolate cyclohydrolase
MKIFDGKLFAAQKEIELAQQVVQTTQKRGGKKIKIAAVLFWEDIGSQVYSENKQSAAMRVGIDYQLHNFSIVGPVDPVLELLGKLNSDADVTGIIIQKPTFATWQKHSTDAQKTKQDFNLWWHNLYAAVDPKKDVDGLHPSTIQAIVDGSWQSQGRVLPATVEAVRAVLGLSEIASITSQPEHKFVIIGKSDLVGLPMYHLLKAQGRAVDLIGSKELQERIENGSKLLDADTIVTATGKRHLITGDMIKPGVILIDVGEPQPDVDWASTAQKAAFITPVPGGIGPVTIVFLLINAVKLANVL